jgi:hypothetical protein
MMKSKRRSKTELREEARKQGHWDYEAVMADRRLYELPSTVSDLVLAEAIADHAIASHLSWSVGYAMCLSVRNDAQHGERSWMLECFETNDIGDARQWFVARTFEGKRVYVGSHPKGSASSQTTWRCATTCPAQAPQASANGASGGQGEACCAGG